jgi:WD40 repeat protein/serine/threonine protein kinase
VVTDRDARPAIRPGILVDHFKISRLVGKGGMGEVYLARDTTLGRKVALKILRPKVFDSELGVERFLFEARATAKFSHPHIITIYGAGQYGDRPYVALEYLEGETLRDRVNRERSGFNQTVRVGVAIADALREAHHHKILHRDLKPENVMIPVDGRIRVLDFGLAKAVSSDETWELRDDETREWGGGETLEWQGDGTAAGGTEAYTTFETFETFRTMGEGLRGTPRYMAPEQWTRSPVTPATDVWALGLILYELVSGQHPWPGANAIQLCHLISSPGPVPPLAGSVQPDLRALVESCVLKDPEKRPQVESILQTLETLRPGTPSRVESRRTPFRGLLPCDERDAGLFFGRDAEVAAFLEQMRLEPVLPIVGPSGAGKSSFVQAGIIPRLEEQERWVVLKLRPGRRPMRSLSLRLLSAGRRNTTSSGGRGNDVGTGGSVSGSGSSSGPTLKELEAAEASLTQELHESPARLALKLSEIADREQARVLLFVDQLEELYTLVSDRATRHTFMEALCMAADDPEGPARVVLTLRDDFLGRLAVGEVSRQTLGRVTVLRSPRPEALEEILTRPVAASGYHYDDPGLVREMVSDVEGEAAALPLLQVAGQTLWELRDRRKRLLRRSAYVAMGGVAGALARHADGVLDVLSADQLAIARQVLVSLVSAEGTRAVVPQARLVEELGPSAEEVIDRLVQGRLILIRKARKGRGEAELELVHESLVSTWTLLGRWIDEGRERRVFIDEVRQAAELWERRGRPIQEVWQEEALADARRMGERVGALPDVVQRFLDAGTKRERRIARRRRVVTVSVIAALAIPIAFAGIVLAWQRNEAVTEQIRAESAMWEAKGSELVSRGRPGASLAAVRSSATLSSDPERQRDRLSFLLATIPSRVLEGHAGTLYAAAVTPDGERLVTGSHDKTARVWDLETGRLIHVLEGHEAPIFAAAITPDGERLVTGSQDDTARVWDLGTGRLIHVLEGHDADILAAAITPDGERLVTGSGDHTARVWDLEAGREIQVIQAHDATIEAAAVTPDGQRLITGSRDGTARVWDLETGTALHSLEGHAGRIEAVAISSDGRKLVTGSGDRTARVWDLETGTALHSLEGHEADIFAVAITPDGGRLVTGSGDHTARMWDLETGAEIHVLEGHEAPIYSAVISPSGGKLVTGSMDNTARVWDLDADPVIHVLEGHDDSVEVAAVTPDGRRLVTGSMDHTARVWDLEAGQVIHVLEGHEGSIYAAAITPDGRRLVTGSEDKTARVWDLETGQVIHVLEGHEADLFAAAITPDGRRLVTGSQDRTMRVWDVESGRMLRVLAELEATIWVAAITPDGERLVTGSGDATARVWDIETGQLLQVLEGHDGAIEAAAITPDGRHLVTGSYDGTARVWDLGIGQLVHVLEGHEAPIFAAAVTPNGEQVVTGSLDKTARVWDLETGTVIHVLEGHEDTLWTAAVTPDGGRLVTGSGDSTARVWDLDPRSHPRRTFSELLEHAGAVTNYRACRSTGEVVAILPFPEPDTLWAPESRCGSTAADSPGAEVQD